jgi:superkiller protein 3
LVEAGAALSRSGERSAAEAAYLQLIALQPHDPSPYLLLAGLYQEWNRVEEGLCAVAAAERLGGPFGEISSLRASLFANQGDWETAAVYGRMAVRSDPSNVKVRHLVARAYLDMGLVDDARAEYEELIQINIDDTSAQEMLGVILVPTSQVEAAQHLSQAATPLAREILGELDDNSPALQLGRAGHICTRHSEWGLAAFILEQAISLSPHYSDAHALLGQSLGQLGRAELALDHLERAVELDPESPLAHSLLGLNRIRAGDTAAAQLHLETAYDLDPDNAVICLNLAYVHADLGQYGPADIWMREALRLADDSPGIWEAAARYYVSQQFVPSGLAASQMWAELEPDDGAAFDMLAWAQFLSGQVSEAEENLQMAIDLDPSLAVAYYHLGQVHNFRGRYAAAEDAFRRALDLSTDPRLRSELEQLLQPSQ